MRVLFIFSILFTFSFGEFVKSENIVIDKKQNLMWQDNIEVTYQEDITMGNVYCDELVLNGYIDWRLPTIKELQGLLDQEAKEHYLEKTFEFFEVGDYYSNTPNANNSRKYWYIDFKTGIITSKAKHRIGFIRCVRRMP